MGAAMASCGVWQIAPLGRLPGYLDFFADGHAEHHPGTITDNLHLQTVALSDESDQRHLRLLVTERKYAVGLVIVAPNRDTVITRRAFQLVRGDIRD